MGYGGWSDAAYTDRVDTAKSSGKDLFAYSDVARSTGKSHDKLDPKKIKNGVREARDSDAHPNSKPVFIGLDVTGSMSNVPRIVQEKLPSLMGLLIRKGYLADPAICMSAIGDATSDRVPFQVGQFESGIEIDDDIRNIFMEGGGGGTKEESYDLALFFLARMTQSDAFDKRGEKGYAFIICDEDVRTTIKASEVENVFGSRMGLQGDVPLEDIVAEVKERWNLFVVIPNMTSHYNDPYYSEQWRKHFGQNVIRLQDAEGIVELIASTIGLAEDNVSLDSLVDDLEDHGTNSRVAKSVSRSLATVEVGGGALNKLSGGSTGLATL